MSKKIQTKTLTTLALSISIQIIVLYLCIILPTISMALLFISSVINGALCEKGINKYHVLLSYIGTSILALVLISRMEINLFYILFFGWYGIVHYISKNRKLFFKQLIRWSGFIIGLIVLVFAFRDIISPFIRYSIWIYVAGAAVGFVLYQIIYTLVIKEMKRRKLI